MSPQATYTGHVRSPASHSTLGGYKRDSNPFDGELPDHDALAVVVFGLIIALCLLVPIVGIALIKLSN